MLAILLIFIFIRPFISSLAFPYLNCIYSYFFIGYLFIWAILRGIYIKKIQTLKYPLILFCLALIISVVFSSNKSNSLEELYKYIGGLFLFLIAISLKYEEKNRLIHIIVLAGLIISLLAIYQYFFGFKHTLEYMAKVKITDPFALDYITRKRVYLPFVTSNVLAGYLAMIIPLALINKNRVLFIISLSFALFLTKSLGAFLSLWLGFIIYFYLQGRLEKKRILFLSGLLIIIGLVFIIRSIIPKQHLQPIFSTMMRLGYWGDTLGIIKRAPLTGIGLGNFNLMQSRYVHNSYLQLWAEMGITGITTLLWLIMSVFKSVAKNTKDLPNKNQIVCLSTANAVFLIHNLVDFSFFLPEVSLIWWVILGMLLF